jgi:hypothetical protein
LKKNTPLGIPKIYDFQFEIPEQIISENNFGQGVFGSAMSWLQNMTNNTIKLFVQAKLDLEMAFDVSATQQIRVVPRINYYSHSQGAIQN